VNDVDQAVTVVVPDQVSAGQVRITLVNHGTRLHDVAVFRSAPDADVEVLDQLLQGPAPHSALGRVRFAGGVGPAGPGDNATATLRLEPGTYWLGSFTTGPDGRTDVLHGLLRRIEVTGPGSDQPAPDSELTIAGTIVIGDDRIALPTRSSGEEGPRWFRVRNGGTRRHSLALVRPAEGKPPDETRAWLVATESGPPPTSPPFTAVGGTGPLEPGMEAAILVDANGSIVAFDRWPDPEPGGAPGYHVEGLFEIWD
jgi:hypothetical protein